MHSLISSGVLSSIGVPLYRSFLTCGVLSWRRESLCLLSRIVVGEEKDLEGMTRLDEEEDLEKVSGPDEERDLEGVTWSGENKGLEGVLCSGEEGGVTSLRKDVFQEEKI